MDAPSKSLPHVVIIGGGFAGFAAARALHRAPVRVTLIDRRNHHLFQPLLYQVATAALAAPDVAAPIRTMLKRHKRTTVFLAEVTDIDLDGSRVIYTGGATDYDHLIVAAGAVNSWFGHDEAWSRHAPGLKTIDDAFEIRRRVLCAYEAAEMASEPAALDRLMTFVVVGGGPTGVELAGALNEISRKTMRQNFRHFDPASARVILVEGGPGLLAAFPDKLGAYALKRLTKTGVEVRLNTFVGDIDEQGVTLADGERIDAATVLWGAGVRGAEIGGSLVNEAARDGRVSVDGTLNLAGHPEVYVVGDLARANDGTVDVPGIANAATQMGDFAAQTIKRRLAGKATPTFKYRDKGIMATIGRSSAVAQVGRFAFSGLFAWLLWIFIHIMYLANYRSRIVVFFEWAWAFFTWNRPGRIMQQGRTTYAAPDPPAISADESTGD